MKVESAIQNQKCSLIGSGRKVCLDLLSVMINLASGFTTLNLKSGSDNRVIFINQLKLHAMTSSLVMQF
jgi:hypothetical protein